MFTIEFSTSNAAYAGDDDRPEPEFVAETVAYVVAQLNDGFTSGRVTDPNGDHVGHWTLTDD